MLGGQQVSVTMKEDNSGKQVTREIDISNLIDWDSGRVITDPDQQKEKLGEWISERAEAQHDCSLTLLSWYIF